MVTRKLPAIHWYTGDWMKDPRLSRCSPATRGIWADLLCAMHEDDRSGSLSTEELSTLLKTYYKLEGLARPLVKVQDEVCAAIDGYDADGSGSLELPECARD